jgi:hypothetical protein
MPTIHGDEVHMEVSSANAGGTAIPFVLYNMASTTARTLLATEFVTVTDIIFISTAGGAYTLTAGASDGAGKRIAKGNAAALGGLAHHFETPFCCPAGVLPYLIAAAGQVDCVLTGYISQN